MKPEQQGIMYGVREYHIDEGSSYEVLQREIKSGPTHVNGAFKEASDNNTGSTGPVLYRIGWTR